MKSPTAIADYLTERRIPTFEDLHPRPPKDGKRQLKKRGYGEWYNASIYKILKHPAYKGKMPYYRTSRVTDPQTGKRVEKVRPLDDPAIVWVDVPAIVSEEDWEESQRITKENDSRGGANRKVEYLLSRRLRCGECGCKVSGKVFNAYNRENGKRTHPLYYYVCNTANFKQGRRLKTCKMRMFRQEWVEATVWDYVERHLLDPEGLEIGLRQMQAMREEERQKLETQLADLQQKVESIAAQKQRLIAAVITGVFSPEEVAAQKHQLDSLEQSYTDGIAETELILANVGASEEDIQQLKQYAALIRERLDIHNPEHQRHILRLMGLQAEMQIDPDGTKYLAVTSHLAPANVERVPLISPNSRPS
jgi:site-specific DNA recombinase